MDAGSEASTPDLGRPVVDGGLPAVDAGPWSPPPDEPYPLDLPPGYPGPFVPAGDPLTRPKVELGRHLFYDTRLSGNRTQACSSCHEQARAFTEPRAVSIGSTGEAHFRNAMSLANAGYVSAYTWASPLIETLEEQALLPMFGEFPVELGLTGMQSELIERLRAEPRYQALFPLAFPEDADPFTVRNVTRALAAFQRTLVTYRSPYDRASFGGETGALSDAAQRGFELFYSEDLECFHCHGGFTFSSAVRHDGSMLIGTQFHNTGLYNLPPNGTYLESDNGLRDVTGNAADDGRFRAPTLRNIALTAPYFHDGSAATLDDVIDHYARGGRRIDAGPNAGDGAQNPGKSQFVRGFTLTPAQRADLLEALRSLTDEPLTRDPRYSNPWN